MKEEALVHWSGGGAVGALAPNWIKIKIIKHFIIQLMHKI